MYASSVLSSSSKTQEEELISNQTSCFSMALSGCSIITINVLLEVIGKIAGVKIPEFHRLSDSPLPGMLTTVRHHEGGHTICEEVHSDLVCHTVYPLEVAQLCTPGVYDSWIHRIEECTKLKLKQSGCKIEKTSDVSRCEGLKGKVTECIMELGDTPCRQMKMKVFNISIPMFITVPKSYPPLVKGNKEHIRTTVQDCMNTLDEELVNKCVPNLYSALASIAMENPALRPHSLSDEKNSNCLAPLFKGCNLLSRESLQQHLGKDFGAFINLTFGEGNVKWFSEIPAGSDKVTVFGVEEPQSKDHHGQVKDHHGQVKDHHGQVKDPCSVKKLSEWKDSNTKCVSAAVVDVGRHDPHALTLKRMIDETQKCIDKVGPLPCQLETRTDYDHFLTYLLDLIRHHTIVKKDDSSVLLSFWKRALGQNADEQKDKKCHDSLKFKNIKDCAHNIYMYLTLLENSPSSVAAMARENEKNQECIAQSLKDCPKPVISGIMSIFMAAVGHRPRETRDVIGAEPYRHKRLVSIHPIYGGVVTVCEEETHAVHPATPPMIAIEPERKPAHPHHNHHHHTKRHLTVPNVLPRVHATDTTLKTARPLPTKPITLEISEEEFTEIGTDPTSSPQCTEEEVETWIAKAKGCGQIRLFQLYQAYETKCLQLDSSSIFGNVSLCISEMEPLMAQCGHERIYVFESIMEHLQKMIQQLQVEAKQKCQSTKFCLPDKTQLVKCAGPFFDHMREMKDTGKNYESSKNLRSMKDVEQCLAAEMQKCPESIRRTFKEIVFTTYGVDIPESSKEINGNTEYCFIYIPKQASPSGAETFDFRTKRECNTQDVGIWLNRIRNCIDRRINQLRHKSLKVKDIASQKLLRYVEICIHVYRVLPCKPLEYQVFESLIESILSNTKKDLTRLAEALKSKNPNARVEIECIKQLDSKNSKNCLPMLYKDMEYLYSDSSPQMEGLESLRCVSNALTKCNGETLRVLDYILKSSMGFPHPVEKPLEQKTEGTNICRPIKALAIGYTACQSKDLHTELEYISQCLEKSFQGKPPKSVSLGSGIKEAEKCLQKYSVGTCYFADEKSLSLMIEYTFMMMAEFLKKHLLEEDSKCLALVTGSAVSKCAPLSYSYVDSLKKGQVVAAMSVSREALECVRQVVKECGKPVGPQVIQMFGKLSHVSFVMPKSMPSITLEVYQYQYDDKGENKIKRDVNGEPEEYDSGTILSDRLSEESAETITILDETEPGELMEEMENPKGENKIKRGVNGEPEEYDSGIILSDSFSEETAETITILDETELDELMEEMENPKVRRVRNVADDPDTTPEKSRGDDIPANGTVKEETTTTNSTAIGGKDANVTKTDLLTLKQCNESSFTLWVYTYHECFVPSKYEDSATDLNNIVNRILVNIQECMKFSAHKRCFPSIIQVEDFLREVVNQAKDYAEMYLSQITKGRKDITDLKCIENLSVQEYKNCTSDIFEFLDNLRHQLVSSNRFENHVKKTAVCMRYIFEECSKAASTALIEVVEVLLDLSNGTMANKLVMMSNENPPHESKSIGAKIVDFFKKVGHAIATPFVWLYNAIKSLFGW